MLWVVLCVSVFISFAFLRMSKKHNVVNLFGEIFAAASLWFLAAYPLTATKKVELIMELVLAGFATIMLVVFLIRYLHGIKNKHRVKSSVQQPKQTETVHLPVEGQSFGIDRMPGQSAKEITEDRMPGAPYNAKQAHMATEDEAASAKDMHRETSSVNNASKSSSSVLAGKVPKQDLESDKTVAALKMIIGERGIQIYEKPQELISLFGDYEPNLKKEKKLLKNCLEAKITKDLIGCMDKPAERQASVRQQCIERVVSSELINRVAAEQAVDWICKSIAE